MLQGERRPHSQRIAMDHVRSRPAVLPGIILDMLLGTVPENKREPLGFPCDFDAKYRPAPRGDQCPQPSAGFVSAQDLHGLITKNGGAIALATVYTQLKKLAEGDDVDLVMTDRGETLYRRCVIDIHHHHLACRVCGATVEVDAPDLELWANEIAAKHGYRDLRTCSNSTESARRASPTEASLRRARSSSSPLRRDLSPMGCRSVRDRPLRRGERRSLRVAHLGLHVGDDPVDVAENRERVARAWASGPITSSSSIKCTAPVLLTRKWGLQSRRPTGSSARVRTSPSRSWWLTACRSF